MRTRACWASSTTARASRTCTLFSFNQFGDLTPSGLPITVGVPNANGVAILTPRSNDDN